MTNITLSIEDSVYNKMRKFSEIKWSDFVRKVIKQRIEEMEMIEKSSKKQKDVTILADEKLLAQDWLSPEDNEAWKDL